MIIFNTTFHVGDDVHDDCLLFFRNTYIPQAVSSGFLFDPRLALIHAQHEENGVSYSLQFKVKNVETLNHWLASDGQTLQTTLTSLFGNKVLGFITLLEEVSL